MAKSHEPEHHGHPHGHGHPHEPATSSTRIAGEKDDDKDKATGPTAGTAPTDAPGVFHGQTVVPPELHTTPSSPPFKPGVYDGGPETEFIVAHESVGPYTRGQRVTLENLKDADVNRLVDLGALAPAPPEEKDDDKDKAKDKDK